MAKYTTDVKVFQVYDGPESELIFAKNISEVVKSYAAGLDSDVQKMNLDHLELKITLISADRLLTMTDEKTNEVLQKTAAEWASGLWASNEEGLK